MDRKIQIHVRIRNTPESIWDVENNTLYYIVDGKKISVDSFDSVFYREHNLEIYQKAVSQAIQKFKESENVTIFAYGQTGSGKTHTILGGVEQGLIRLSLKDIFPEKIKISFIELFNEKIFDLFTKKELRMYQQNGSVTIHSLHVQEVCSFEEAMCFIDTGLENRRTGMTDFNASSSRSHAILQIRKGNAALNFVDLAGSERACYDEKRMKEAAFINRSLLALGKLVNNILNNKVFGFRDSKLTRLLQDSIMNKSNILAFCMINPDKNCLSESLSTLNFAARLSNVDLKIAESTVSINNKGNQAIYTIDFDKMNNSNKKFIEILKNRINSLENTVLSILDQLSNQELFNAFVLEKQLFQLEIEELESEISAKMI